MKQERFAYAGYLAIKKTIDDESLNPETWKHFSQWLLDRQRQQESLEILEIGAGTGTMILRLLDAGLLRHCVYHCMEIEAAFRDVALSNLQAWCHTNACQLEKVSDTHWLISRDAARVEFHWVSADVLQVEEFYPPASIDLLLGHAVIDLLPVPTFLPVLLDRLPENGACFFTINYAGATVLHPPHPLDETILNAYHQDMDKRFPDLDWQASHTGQLLGPWLQSRQVSILAEGASDWQLSPPADKDNERNRFVANILDTIESALPALEGLPGWLANRRRQLAAGELHFRAANTDVLGICDKQF